ncbi:MAG: LacI family transcriptional regulator [Victivallales bacterium]|jgi:DNA-binding LacI/PurR family transcriptional regulator|nr:LacI family transcriptional regulator [Victivallales bacterium]
MKKKSDLTVYDIARLAGVSTATVSRVLNQNSGVNPQTVRKVNEVLTQNNFKPRWKAGGSKIIGMIPPDFDGTLAEPFCSQVVSAVYDSLRKHGYSLSLLSQNMQKNNTFGRNTFGRNHQLSGIIILSTPNNYAFCEKMLACSDEFPCVVIGKLTNDIPDRTSGFNHILANDYAAGYQLATLIARHNHRRIMIVTPYQGDVGHLHRMEGITEALKNSGISSSELSFREFRENLRQNGEQLAADLACDTHKPDAIIFTQGSICSGFVMGCQSMKLRIPDDFSVVTFADNNEFAFTNPPITTMNSPNEKLGERAVKALMAQLNQEHFRESGLIQHVFHNRHSIRTQ